MMSTPALMGAMNAANKTSLNGEDMKQKEQSPLRYNHRLQDAPPPPPQQQQQQQPYHRPAPAAPRQDPFMLSDDMICALEFERFFASAMGVERGGKYLDAFRAANCADIRCVEQLDEAWLSLHVQSMDILDKRLFKREVHKYCVDAGKFAQILDGIGMLSKYGKAFRNRGIGSLWSYSHHIHKVQDVYMVIMDAKDAQLIYDHLHVLLGGADAQPQHQPQQQQHVQVEGNHMHLGHVHAAVNQRSDSDDMYDGYGGDGGGGTGHVLNGFLGQTGQVQ